MIAHKTSKNRRLEVDSGGEGEIRTPDTVARMPHFECGAFNHSATSPGCEGLGGPLVEAGWISRGFVLFKRPFAGF
jgi:hypothetical protein